MSVDFKTSETKLNLMRAFAGESQARNRYTFAASKAREAKLHVIETIFTFTANQEKEHAEIFYGFLKDLAGENIKIDGCYPVDINESIAKLLRYAQHNEFEEHDDVYKNFSEIAQKEGFSEISTAFSNIAKIEKKHGERFEKYAKLLEENKLFVSDIECDWICLNCGYIINAKQAPEICPVCKHDKGFFIRLKFIEE